MSSFGRTAPGAFQVASVGQNSGRLEDRVLRPRRRHWLYLLSWPVAAALLFACYLRVSGTAPVNSDGASNALQAWDMLHGNLLLHGWWLSDVSFYTTELPQYALLELVFGLHPSVVHLAGAMTYTLVVLLVALLAKGKARGAVGTGQALIAAGIMLAPQLGGGAYILLLSPDHVGSTVPVLAAFLILDRAPRRWYAQVLVGALLAWALVADQVVLVTGVLPLVAVCAGRSYLGAVRQQRSWAAQWYPLLLGGTALAGVAVAWLIQAAIHAEGGYYLAPLTGISAPASALSAPLHIAAKTALYHHHTTLHQFLNRIPGILYSDFQAVLLLFGANFIGQPTGLLTGMALIHLAGVILAGCAVWIGVRNLSRERDLVSSVLVVAVLINGVAYVLRTHNADIFGAREIAAVLPFSAALIGRQLGIRLTMSWLRPFVLLVLACYLACLGYAVAQPQVAAADQRLADWLAARHLRSGLAGYWQADGTTLASGWRVQVSPVCPAKNSFSMEQWESKAIWYSPRQREANFLVVGGQVSCHQATAAQGRSVFGPPAETYKVGPYTILVWRRNLLTVLR